LIFDKLFTSESSGEGFYEAPPPPQIAFFIASKTDLIVSHSIPIITKIFMKKSHNKRIIIAHPILIDYCLFQAEITPLSSAFTIKLLTKIKIITTTIINSLKAAI
jgi:hypothetical protein